MAIATQAGLIAAMAGGQQIVYGKTAIRTGVAMTWTSVFDLAGTHIGTLAGTSTAAGVVPDDSTAGCPTINGFSGANIGYLGAVAFNTFAIGANAVVGGRRRLCDMLFKAGAYSFNSNVTLAAQPSYSARIPGADYKGTEIWFEAVTAFTGNPTITITYTNQDGTAGKSTSIAVGSAPLVGRMIQIPLAAGDTGVQKIESVVASVATVGTFNILVLRPLWMGYSCSLAPLSQEEVQGPDKTDLPVLFATSALIMQVSETSAANTNAFDALLTIING